MMRTPVILGIDASLSCTGWSLMSLSEERVLAWGKIPTKPIKKKKGSPKLPKGLYREEGFFSRVKQIVEAVDAAIDAYPDLVVVAIAVEQLNSFRGAGVARTLAGVSKILQYHLWVKLGVMAYEVHTTTAKLAFTGNGAAGKALVLVLANTHFKLQPPLVYYEDGTKERKAGNSWDDVSDSIAVSATLKKHLGKEIFNSLDK